MGEGSDGKHHGRVLPIVLVCAGVAALVAWLAVAFFPAAPGGGTPGAVTQAEDTQTEGSEGEEPQETWLPVGATLSIENEETGELEKVAEITLARDDDGRLMGYHEIDYADGVVTSDAETRYGYDEEGRVATREVRYAGSDGAGGSASEYGYDDAGLLMSIESPGDASSGMELFSYDEGGRLSEIMQTYDYSQTATPNSAVSSNTFIVRVVYDDAGQPVAVTSGDESSYEGSDASVSAAWRYDADGKLAGFSVAPLGEDVANLMDSALAYDEEGRVASVTCSPGDYLRAGSEGEEKAGYDAEIAYAYDEEGRPSEAHATGAYTYGATFETTATCAWDDHGNLVKLDVVDANVFEGQASIQHSVIERRFGQFRAAPEGEAAEAANGSVPGTGELLYLEPTFDKQLFALYLGEPSLPVAPDFAPPFISATYLGYRPVLASH